MNQHLQDILDFIQLNEGLSSEQRNTILKSLRDADKDLEITAFKLDRTEKVKKTTAILLEETIAELEQKRKAVEAQNRELEIETALERVRSSALAMKQPADMLEVCKIISQQLTSLNVKEIRNVQTAIFYETKGTYVNYEYYAKHDKLIITEVDYKNHPLQLAFANQMLQGEGKVFTRSLTGRELHDWYEHQKTTNQFADSYLENADSLNYHWHSLGPVALGLSTYFPLTESETGLFKRFRNVFELAYRRFIDIEQAEALAREAQIELGLERVRARAMAMHSSEDLSETVNIFFKELKTLGITPMRCGVGEVHAETHTSDLAFTTASNQGESYEIVGKLKHEGHPVIENIYKQWKLQAEYHPVLQGADIKAYYSVIKPQITFPDFPEYTTHYGNYFYFKEGFVFAWSEKELSEEGLRIFRKFTSVLSLTFRRYKDLKEAEAQARESQIQLALERVRARTMAMQKSDELLETSHVLFEQFKDLGEPADQLTIGVVKESENVVEVSATFQGNILQQTFRHGIDEPIVMSKIVKGWKAQKKSLILEVKGKELEAYNQYRNELVGSEMFPTKIATGSQRILQVAYFSKGMLALGTNEKRPQESLQLLERFASVFDLTYTRFLDLKNAEAQAREAKIEAALERVRSKAMAMHKSEDLHGAVATVFEELDKLCQGILRCGIAILDKEKPMSDTWITVKTDQGSIIQVAGGESLDIHPMLQNAYDAWLRQEDLFHVLQGEELASYYQALDKTSFQSPVSATFHLEKEEQRQFYFNAVFQDGSLFAFMDTNITDEVKVIMKRFAGVFNLTYKRFLDLQKAEAQAREAQIEAALERVRGKTMAMHNSQDVGETVATMFDELSKLGIETFRCGIGIMHEMEDMEVWTAKPGNAGKPELVIGHINMQLHPLLQGAISSWKNKQEKYSYQLEDEDLLNYFNAINSYAAYPVKYELGSLPKKIFHNEFYFAEGMVYAFSLEQLTDEFAQIFKRFSHVFGQTYRRYLDLQKAEAQAREAQIQLALERVRARTMAMQKSDELSETSYLLFEQWKGLGNNIDQISIGIFNDNETAMKLYSTLHGSQWKKAARIEYDKHSVYGQIFSAWKEQKKSFVADLSGKELSDLNKFKMDATDYQIWSKDELPQDRWIIYVAFFSNGMLSLATEEPQPKESVELLGRFANVFDQTYTRFLDLQKAEAQAMEAIKRASVDRVRAEIASMRTTADLERITPLIWNELTTLGVPFIRCGVFIMDEEKQEVQTLLSTPDGKAIAAFRQPYNAPGEISAIVDSWHKKEIYKQHWNEAQFLEFAKSLVQQGAAKSGEKYLTENRPTDLYLHFLPFLQGMLYAGNTASLSEDELQLVQNLADAFSTAYARYEDFNKLEAAKKQVDSTLNELQATQKQLIQSEKMASLGELTAGIAHEIQNPLNFVNNFSEVSSELLDEMKTELDKGDADEAKIIADNVKQNLEKILHHGKRADAIVKGMLQHSRSSSGQKELTDINQLADEYLRLSYHGLRAKDKTFNAKFETDLDPTIGKLNVLPQDIGRVILNLINNAFYAVTEKKKQNTNGYEPTVTVSTRKLEDKVEVKVKDNGNGIPKKVLDKIFQPFFTTKPTGQGTGLGLSLSYDIITKGHGGELKVETKEGEGSEFIIQLPGN